MVTYKFPGDKEKNGGPISNSLLSKLQKDILTGKLKAGQKLTEQELCREYEVSRTPVREALRQLETDGLVENILNRGAFVIGMDLGIVKETPQAPEINDEITDLDPTDSYLDTKYTSSNGMIVKTTYSNGKVFILNYNNFAVTIPGYEGVIPELGYMMINTDGTITISNTEGGAE